MYNHGAALAVHPDSFALDPLLVQQSLEQTPVNNVPLFSQVVVDPFCADPEHADN